MLRVQGYGHTAEASSGLDKITDLSSRMLEKEVALNEKASQQAVSVGSCVAVQLCSMCVILCLLCPTD